MFSSYFKMAVRHLRKQRFYALLNVIGLSIGLTCFLLIALFVRHELSYDTFHEKADRLYRVVKEDPGNFYLGTNHFAVTSAPLAGALMEEFPEVEHAAQIESVRAVLEHKGTRFTEEGIYATKHFFDVFTYPILEGHPTTVLAEPNHVVLSESLAKKYFGNEDPMGQTLSFLYYSDRLTLTVVGIMEDPPANSHISFDFVVSMASNGDYADMLDHWDSNNYLTYATLYPGQSYERFNAKLPALAHKYLSQREYYQENPGQISIYYAQPVTDIHLRSHINFEFQPNGDIKYVYLFSAIALLILLIACINYMNLATARSGMRAKEVGVRKVMGAHRAQLIGQFMGEAIIQTVIALLLAVVLVALLLPTFNDLTSRAMTLNLGGNGGLLAVLVLIGLAVGILAGSYPAFMISRYHPISVMKGVLGLRPGKTTLRNVLVVAQFSITIALIVGTLVVQRQLHFMQTTNTGVDRTQVVSIQLKDREVRGQYDAIKQALLQHSGIIQVTAARNDPTRITSNSGTRSWEGAEEGQHISIYNTSIEPDYLDVFGIELVEGRALSADITSDVDGMLINETTAKQLGWESAVGKWIRFRGKERPVIGVVRDFNFLSLHQEMAPLAMILNPGQLTRVMVKVSPNNLPESLAYIEQTMVTFQPDYPFEYHFLDDAFNNMYQTETRLGGLFSYFTGLALVIACLGLFGLAAFTAAQRTKEIGVRKVLGASVADILVLLSKDFTRLVGIAFVVGAPVAYIAMNTWLQDFAYRIALGWGTFVLAGIAALLIAWLTVSYQSLKAARVNPAVTLRSE